VPDFRISGLSKAFDENVALDDLHRATAVVACALADLLA